MFLMTFSQKAGLKTHNLLPHIGVVDLKLNASVGKINKKIIKTIDKIHLKFEAMPGFISNGVLRMPIVISFALVKSGDFNVFSESETVQHEKLEGIVLKKKLVERELGR